MNLGPFGHPFLLEGGLQLVHEATSLMPHVHDAYQLQYMLTGNLTRELGDGTFQHLHGGDIGIVKPGTRHGGAHGVVRPCRYIYLVMKDSARDLRQLFTAEETDGILRVLGRAGNCVVHARVEQAAVVQHLVQAADDMRDGQPVPGQEAWVRLLLGQLILCAVRAIEQPQRPTQYHAILEARRLIENDETDTLSAVQIAAAVHLSPSRFRELFHQVTGQTVGNYRHSLRCERAARLLMTTSRSVTEIAHGLGFCSSQYFARTFRRYMGLSPAAWRNQSKHASDFQAG